MAKTYVKLGGKAFSFADPFTGFNIARGEVKELGTMNQRRSGKIKRALAGGHLTPATEAEFKAFNSGEVIEKEVPEIKGKFDDMTKAQLAEYYKENFQVKDDEVEAFSEMKKSEMIVELEDLEKEE